VVRTSTEATSSSAAAARRLFSATSARDVVVPKDAPNLRQASRPPQGPIEAPIVNPADKYASKAENLHRYGNWLMACLPKYIQQFSLWKDELTIYICPSGVIPVFSFLKCKALSLLRLFRCGFFVPLY
jgi:NADH dehydrogenase (ubiquinone) Fe-S protein 3